MVIQAISLTLQAMSLTLVNSTHDSSVKLTNTILVASISGFSLIASSSTDAVHRPYIADGVMQRDTIVNNEGCRVQHTSRHSGHSAGFAGEFSIIAAN